LIRPGRTLSALERANIYNRQYWYRLLDSLAEDFPAVIRLLGEKQFLRLSIAYLHEHPSRSFTLRNLGRRLPGFLRKHPEWLPEARGLAADVARLEWAKVEAFDGFEYPPIEASDLASDSAEQIPLRLQPLVQLMALSFDVVGFAAGVREDVRTSDTGVSNAVTHFQPRRNQRQGTLPSRRTNHVAVHRHMGSIYFRPLHPIEFRLLTALRRGTTLSLLMGQAAELAGQHGEDSIADLGQWFAAWSSLGWLTKHP
jgi:hypothetical protein